MKRAPKPKALIHTIECRSVISAEQAETCPLCRVRVAGPELLEACKKLPDRKSILEDCAYQGGGIPKKWIAERTQFINGYNQALEDVARMRKEAIAKAEVKQ